MGKFLIKVKEEDMTRLLIELSIVKKRFEEINKSRKSSPLRFAYGKAFGIESKNVAMATCNYNKISDTEVKMELNMMGEAIMKPGLLLGKMKSMFENFGAKITEIKEEGK